MLAWVLLTSSKQARQILQTPRVRWRFQEASGHRSPLCCCLYPTPVNGGRSSDNHLRQQAGRYYHVVLDVDSTAEFSVSRYQCLSSILSPWAAFSSPSSPLLCWWIYIIFIYVLSDCPVSSSVETVCGWFPCTGMTRAKVRSFHDSFPLCCTQAVDGFVGESLRCQTQEGFSSYRGPEAPLCPELEELSS